MVFFAEGTRSPDGALHAFKKGPFVMAIEGGVSIVPVGLVGSRWVMPKGSFRIRRGTITVRVGKPISVEGMEHADRDRLCLDVRAAVARLRGGEGRTSRLPGERPLDDVLELSPRPPSQEPSDRSVTSGRLTKYFNGFPRSK